MSVPIIYTTDLFHPHDDPDDHFDLATLFALPELDIQAVVIDRGKQSKGRTGDIPVQQMMQITGRQVPYALGMLQDVSWHGYVPEDELDGVKLIIQALRESDRPVTLFTTGSLRDVAEAYSREPELFQRKVARLYINAGHSGGKEEWNVQLEPGAYFRMLRAHLPIYWMPCFGDDGYQTYWKFRQGEVLESAPLELQNFFAYALNQTSPQEIDPIEALQRPIPDASKEKIWSIERNMWCTSGFLHAVNRENDTFTFTKMKVMLNEAEAKTTFSDSDSGVELMTFQQNDANAYTHSMTQTLKNLLTSLRK